MYSDGDMYIVLLWWVGDLGLQFTHERARTHMHTHTPGLHLVVRARGGFCLPSLKSQ